MNITGSAEVMLAGQHVIRANGSGGRNLQTSSGVRVSRASASFTAGTQIMSNTGPGILSDFNASVQLGSGVTIAGNTAGGARLLHGSVGEVVSPLVLSQPAVCDDTSLIFGDLAGLPIHCSRSDSSGNAELAPGITR